MNVLEKELEDLVYDCLKNNKASLLSDRGLWPVKRYSIFERQLDLGAYGRLDMVGFGYNPFNHETGEDKTLRVGIFEFKKGEINYSTFIQAIRYCKGIEQYVNSRYDYLNIEFKIYLIGTSICHSDFCYLPDFLNNLSIYTTHIDLEKGIVFKSEEQYSLPEASLPKPNLKLESVIKRHILHEIKEKVHSELPF